MTDIVFRNAVIFGLDGRIEGDLRIEDGRIAEVGEVGGSNAAEIDLDGKWLWPGAVDAHVHFRDPGAPVKEDFGSGSAAAVAGGVTTVFEMPNTNPTTTTLERLEQKRALAREKSHCNFGLFFGANPTNLAEAQKVENVPGLKIFMGCSTGDLLVYREEDLERIFAGYDGRICVHAESELRLREREKQFADRDDPAVHSVIRDPQAAAEAVEIAARLAAKYDRHLHVLHLSTQAELDVIAASDARITCEVCPHHLFLDTSAYETHETFVRMNPPLRDASDVAAMWRGLEEGRIDMIATDHAPHTIDEKMQPYRQAPSGVPGVETMLPLMLDAAANGRCTYDQVLAWICHNPARIYGIEDRHAIVPGFWADLVVIDPELEREVSDEAQHTRCAWSPWSGRTLRGWPVATWVNGRIAWDERGHSDARGMEVRFAG